MTAMSANPPKPDGPAPLDEIDALLASSAAALDRGDPVAAEELAERAAAAARSAGDRRRASRADAVRALGLWRQSRAEEAVQLANAALPDTDALGPVEWSIELRHTLTMAYSELMLPGDALPHAVEALRRARELGDSRLLSWSLNRLSVVYQALGNGERAIELLQQAAEAGAAAGHAETQFAAHINLASSLNDQAKLAQEAGNHPLCAALAGRAVMAAREAMQMAQEQPHRLMFCAGIECSALEYLGDAVAMNAAIDRHQDLAARMRLPHFVALGHVSRARALLVAGQVAEACRVLDEKLDEKFGDSAIGRGATDRLILLEARHAVYKAGGRFEEALAALEEVLALERRHLQQRIESQSRTLLREVEIENARHEAAALRRRAAELEHRADAATHAAMQDALTGLANRRALDERLAAWLQPDSSGQRRPLAVAMLDIDHFKHINDNHGHEVGDHVLRQVATLLSSGTRAQDFVARNGGEEFVLAMVADSPQIAHDTCERLRLAVMAHDWRSLIGACGGHGDTEAGEAPTVTVSIGLTTRHDDDDVSSLLRRADMAMYRAKRAGRNRVIDDSALAAEPAAPVITAKIGG
jgi:diguanylate cyclase (GGDEF)-like protein